MTLLSPRDPFSVTSNKLRLLGQGEVVYNNAFAPGVGLIELRHSKRHNSLSGKMMAQFRDIVLVLEQLPPDSDLVALVMTGSRGKSFCAGIDLTFAQDHMQDSAAKETVNRFMHDTLTRFSRLHLITVASIAGPALGGGTELLTAFDYICMDSTTFIRFVQTRMGVSSPWGGARRLVSRIGRKQTLRLLAGAPVINAALGLELGLVDGVVERQQGDAYDGCLRACLDLVHPFVFESESNGRVSPAAVRGMKQLMVSHKLGKQQQPVITFIGAGNMAEALMGGLHNNGFKRLRYVERFATRIGYLATKYPDIVGLPADHKGHEQGLHDANVVILAIKPHQVERVLPVVVKYSPPSALYVSIVGGVTTQQMTKWMGLTLAMIRCMPNTPALLGEGAFGLYANDMVDQEQRDLTDQMMHAVAKKTLWVEKESLIDSVTGISGSGPAYFFLMMEAMQNAGMETCLGAARMAQQVEGKEDLASLREKVTSPNGTTDAAIKSMEANRIRQIIKDAVVAATNRAHVISKELD
ncbi:ClpP/crotonase-like domain-containing protein [Chlamydoabsidia padenii]|nr:ClpP/crotonase-like domain-containing protein [Chlamydoabsidia padenii]